MEWATNSWDETNMMALTEKMLDMGRNAPVNPRVRAPRATAEREGSKGLPATGGELTANVPSLQEELDAVRRERAELQQAIYEAAQVQRRLCAPRELVWGEFE